MADKWTPKGFFPRIFMYIALLVNIAGVIALLILIVTEFIILVNNYQSYVARYGYHYRRSPSFSFFFPLPSSLFPLPSSLPSYLFHSLFQGDRHFFTKRNWQVAKDGYLGDYGCGYVEYTNAPKVCPPSLQGAELIVASRFSDLDPLCPGMFSCSLLVDNTSSLRETRLGNNGTFHWYSARSHYSLYHRHCLRLGMEEYKLQQIRFPICWW